MSPSEILKRRRCELGLLDVDAAKASGLTVDQYGDVEQHSDEFRTALTLFEARKVCTALKLRLPDVLGLPSTEPLTSTRSEAIRVARLKMNLSVDSLADRIGFESSVVNRIESESDFIDDLPIEVVTDIAVALNIPPAELLVPSASAHA